PHRPAAQPARRDEVQDGHAAGEVHLRPSVGDCGTGVCQYLCVWETPQAHPPGRGTDSWSTAGKQVFLGKNGFSTVSLGSNIKLVAATVTNVASVIRRAWLVRARV